MLSIISWNVNGLQSIVRKGTLRDLIDDASADVLCLQEIRCNDDVAARLLSSFNDVYPFVAHNTSKTKKGYSGTAILSKTPLESVRFDLPGCENDEGRVITAVVKGCTIVCVYTPNSGMGNLKRLGYRLKEWDVPFRKYVRSLPAPLFVCGDLNAARDALDIYNPSLVKSAGFTPEERASLEITLKETRLVDTFRALHQHARKYSFWSNFGNARLLNRGWRIDYILADPGTHIETADIMTRVEGSDHAPVFVVAALDKDGNIGLRP